MAQYWLKLSLKRHVTCMGARVALDFKQTFPAFYLFGIFCVRSHGTNAKGLGAIAEQH